MSRELPERPNLEHLRKQAKALLREIQQGEAAAMERIRSIASFPASASVKLADVQHLIAREYGFVNWPKLKEHVESLMRTPAEMLAAAVCASDAKRTARVLES